MKAIIKTLLRTLPIFSISFSTIITAVAEETEGFVFTEEEVAAAEAEEQRQLQALLSDGQAYFTATQQTAGERN